MHVRRQLTSFLLIGLASYLVYLGVFRLLHWRLGDVAAITVAFALAATVNFTLNKSVTFAVPDMAGRRLARYVAVLVIDYAVSTVIALPLLWAGVASPVALGTGIAVTTATGFVLSRRWDFPP